ncbi:ATPase subunit of ABC transporter with duplicated ATPase domains [Agromyces flavus]|uniref:ATPase components of ABC transporters with duplicated ATPase domains n=1 Tax=Agromyces flavus TaxID=589382 RepID=A0A1H1MT58_9MICO|nr:ABC-F family ATP-binding cassette domain-containing protein [Agromyces flavus]MCP2369208.1 ATPase subunit of ABC transporter with duplicated ATPase domains [Agromyces flavus]GGI48689.1 ABC transporter ATP-binding protein [Agromyces flavus]SDR90083.1 ATPase components of ABC transporters with duplicated ATPase domains [Agromyces flavus]
MAHLLGAERLHLEFPTRVVFDEVTLGIDEGDRIGIVGRNGDGKSTLMKLLAGRLEPDGGRVTVRRGIRIGMLDQADALDPATTVADAVVGGIEEHVWAGDAKVRDVIAGLLADVPWQGRVGDLSGGQRRRVGLAALLVGDWDVLFLDEPTNHLDVEGIAWLARHVKGRWAASDGALVVVTHDRWFLDEVCTATWEVHDRVVEPFEGGYAAYVLQRVERDRMAAASEAKRQNLMRKELAWLRRGAPARTSKPKFRIEAANQLIENEPPVRNPVELNRLAVSRLGKDVVDLLDVSVEYPMPDVAPGGPAMRTVLHELEWRIAPGERTGILGVNGAGKSTLLKLVTGEVQPTTGRVKRGKTVKIAVLSQELAELAEWTDERVSAVVAAQRTSYTIGSGSKAVELTPGQLLERLGFTNQQLATPVRDLSGGQKRRLQLLLILLQEPNVLILDEPTNDLDTDMLAAIEDLLDAWPGTLLVVSHDRYLVERVTDRQVAILDGHLRDLPRGVDQYLELRRQQAADVEARPAPPTATRSPGPAAPAQLAGADRRAAEKEIASIDRRLEKLQAQIAAQHERLARHDQSDYVGLGVLGDELAELEGAVADLETRWLEVSEQLEG